MFFEVRKRPHGTGFVFGLPRHPAVVPLDKRNNGDNGRADYDQQPYEVHGPSIGHLMQFVVSNALRAKVWLAGCFASAYGMSTISAASTFSAPGNTGHNVSTSIYRGWRTLTSDVQVQDGVDKRTTEDRR